MGGGGGITEILNKEGGSHAIYMVCRGGGAYRNLELSSIFFPPPTPLYINNDRSLILIYFKWRDTENQHSTSKEISFEIP